MPGQYTSAPVDCGHCGKSFYPRIDGVRVGGGRFCSRSCSKFKPFSYTLTEDGTAARIPLHDRHGAVRAYTLIDVGDLELAQQNRWLMSASGYAIRSIRVDGAMKSLRLHRVILGLPPGRIPEVDHINRDKLDNRRDNLRVLSAAANKQNVPARLGASSKYRGVHWDKKRRKWIAQISVSNKSIHVGTFTSEIDAANAALSARLAAMPYAKNEYDLHSGNRIDLNAL